MSIYTDDTNKSENKNLEKGDYKPLAESLKTLEVGAATKDTTTYVRDEFVNDKQEEKVFKEKV